MKLMSSDLSPYSARVRAQIRHFDLPVDIVEPDAPLRTEAFLARHPLGKIPILQLDDGRELAESWSIMQYLADIYAEKQMTPRDPFEKAIVGMKVRYADLHLAPSLFPMFRALMTKSDINIESEMALINAELAKGEALFSQYTNESADIDLADLAIAPTFYFVIATPAIFGVKDVLADFPILSAWWERVNATDSIAKTIAEVDAAFRAMGS